MAKNGQWKGTRHGEIELFIQNTDTILCSIVKQLGRHVYAITCTYIHMMRSDHNEVKRDMHVCVWT